MLIFIHLTNIFYVARELMFGYKSQMLSKCGQNKNVTHEVLPPSWIYILCDQLLNRPSVTWELLVLHGKEAECSYW